MVDLIGLYQLNSLAIPLFISSLAERSLSLYRIKKGAGHQVFLVACTLSQKLYKGDLHALKLFVGFYCGAKCNN